MIESIMFDFSNYYDRIAEQLPDNCKVVEIGVANGASALYLANALFEKGKTFRLYMIDNMAYGGYEQMKTIYQNIIKSGLSEYIELIPKDSVTASKDFNDDSLHFVFLDSSHEYEPTKQEINAWYSKLIDDFVLAGHDYFLYKDGVGKAVDELVPREIKRETIDNKETGQYQEFKPEQLLFTEQTDNEFGIWELSKRFWWKPTLK